MPLDPLLVNGLVPFGEGVPRAMAMGAELADRRRSTDLYANRLAQQAEQDQWTRQKYELEQQTAQQDQKRKQAALAAYNGLMRNVPGVFEAALPEFLKKNPNMANLSPEDQRAAMLAEVEAMLGQQAQKPPGKLRVEQMPGYGTVLFQGDDIKDTRPYPAPQQVGPATYTTEIILENGVPTLYAINTRNPTQKVRIGEAAGKGDGKGVDQVDMQARLQNRITDTQNVLSAINDAEAVTNLFSTGLVGQVLENVGSTDAVELRAALQTIQGNIGFDRLQRMREESKTGGALGQVAVQELQMLQATIAALDPRQDEKALRRNLGRVRDQYIRAMDAYEAAMQEKGTANPATQGMPSLDQRVRGYYGGSQ